MKRTRRALCLVLCALCLAVGSAPLRLAGDAQRVEGPRLIVVLVVDQLRADYIDVFKHRWRHGFRTLIDQGAYFPRAEYPYLNTLTCASHATIATGTLPRTHGLILNRWWHRDERRSWNCVDDEAASNVSYGRPARLGNSARRLLVPTLADELRAQKTGARVVSLSLKARSAIPLAGRGGVVTWLDEEARAFVTSRAFAAGPVDAMRTFVVRDNFEEDQDKVWTLQDRGTTYRFPDLDPAEKPRAGWTSLFPHPIAGAKGPDNQFLARWERSPFSDAYLGRMAAAMLDAFQLGRRDATDYLAVSFTALDEVGHDFGPRSREVEDLLMHLDTTLGALIQRLDDSVGRDRYVLALTGDHGVAAIPEHEDADHVFAEDLQQLVEEVLVARWGAREGGRYVESITAGHMYFGSGVFERLRGDTAALDAVEDALLSAPGVLRVLQGDRLSAAAGDPVIRAAALSWMTGRGGDLVLVPRENWVAGLRSDNYATSHGSLHDYDRQVPLFLLGGAIAPGRLSDRVTPADIAPTLARIADVMLPKAEGRVLTAALR